MSQQEEIEKNKIRKQLQLLINTDYSRPGRQEFPYANIALEELVNSCYDLLQEIDREPSERYKVLRLEELERVRFDFFDPEREKLSAWEQVKSGYEYRYLLSLNDKYQTKEQRNRFWQNLEELKRFRPDILADCTLQKYTFEDWEVGRLTYGHPGFNYEEFGVLTAANTTEYAAKIGKEWSVAVLPKAVAEKIRTKQKELTEKYVNQTLEAYRANMEERKNTSLNPSRIEEEYLSKIEKCLSNPDSGGNSNYLTKAGQEFRLCLGERYGKTSALGYNNEIAYHVDNLIKQGLTYVYQRANPSLIHSFSEEFIEADALALHQFHEELSETKGNLIQTKMKTIYQLIDERRIGEAIQLLQKELPNHSKNEAILLSSRFNQLEYSIRMDLIPTGEANVERNRIINAILELTKEVQPNESNEPPSRSDYTKKKVLFICSSPDGKNPLDFGREFKKIGNARQSADYRHDFDELEIKTSVEGSELLDILTKYQPDILHISLHSSKSKGLYFEDVAGKVEPMEVEDFADLIETYCSDPDGKGKIETIVLSSCNSKIYGEAIQDFADHIIATQDFFPSEAAIVYAEQFYKMLFNQKDIAFAHRAAAVTIKRKKYPPQSDFPVHEIPILLKNQNS